MNIFQKIGTIITRPGEFFDDTIGEGIGPAFGFYAFIWLIFLIFVIPVVLVLAFFVGSSIAAILGVEAGVMLGGATLLFAALMGIGMYLSALIFSFVWAAILHLWCLIWGGIGDYADSYKICVYASTPALLFGWIPGINGLAQIWSLILVGVGLVRLHNVSTLRAVLMIIIPFIIFIGLFILLWVWGLATATSA
ncbi:YIP1 family protein [Candidatus Woesearchaeota archaeon]|nr:YIP1 family protein [Candidatus Woesearchaeota archaeon]